MIRADELMVGDLVFVSEKPYKITAIRKDNFSKNRIQIDNEVQTWQREDTIEPIPITPEILEKSGFEQGKGFEQRWYITDVGDKRITIYRSNTFWSLMINKGIWPLLNNINVHSAHELQHALRLCGIEKEIVL